MMFRHPLAFEVFTEIAIINQLSTAMLQSVMPDRLTQAQFALLSHFVRRAIATESPANLAKALQVTRSTMTSTLTRMERGGLVDVVSDPTDGRAKLVSITEKGRTTYTACIAATEPLIPKISGVLSPSDLATILPTLKKMRAGLDSLRD